MAEEVHDPLYDGWGTARHCSWTQRELRFATRRGWPAYWNRLGWLPRALATAVAVAASASFTSPIAHPANILVMGPGGYRFIDYLKVGVPLTIVVFITVMFLLPILWPLEPV